MSNSRGSLCIPHLKNALAKVARDVNAQIFDIIGVDIGVEVSWQLSANSAHLVLRAQGVDPFMCDAPDLLDLDHFSEAIQEALHPAVRDGWFKQAITASKK